LGYFACVVVVVVDVSPLEEILLPKHIPRHIGDFFSVSSKNLQFRFVNVAIISVIVIHSILIILFVIMIRLV